MKRIVLSMTLLGIVFSAGLWAHHAAEGIISDDIWNTIDQNLIEADSPHLDFDPDNPGNLMELDIGDETNRAVIVSTGIIEFTSDVDSIEASDIIDTEFADIFAQTMADLNRIPTGVMGYEVVELVDDDNDGYIEYAEISVTEPIGQGNSQDIPSEDSSSVPGNRAGG